jgi:hypothetical protein
MTLPFGVVIYSADEVTERMSRRISRARQKMMPMALELDDKGYVSPIPDDWDEDRRDKQARLNLQIEAGLSDDKLDAMNDYQVELILTMVKSWENGELSADNVLDLKKSEFDELAQMCDESLRSTVIDKEPDIDPKATAADFPV